MGVRLRLARTGRTNRPFFRIAAFDSRTRRDGSPIEYLGHYDPFVEDFDKGVVLDMDRVKHWLDRGAKCTETVASFIKRKGHALPRNAVKGGNRSKGPRPSKRRPAETAQAKAAEANVGAEPRRA